MKCEFENMVGKEVSVETFEMYNAMYLATDLSKQEFVELLNIKAIPESEEAVARRAQAEAFKSQIREQIATLQEELESCKCWLEFDINGKTYWTREIKRIRNEIKALKWVIA